MKKIGTVATLISVLSIFTLIGQAKTSPRGNPSRLGLIGEGVFVVTQVASFVEGSEIKVGDVITYVLVGGQDCKRDTTSQCGQVDNLRILQSAVTGSRAGTPVHIEFLRFNPETGKFDSNETTIITSPHPASRNASTLGVVGVFGFRIKTVDPATEQPELNVGDVIISTTSSGQIEDLEAFRNIVKGQEVGSTIKAEVLRLNPALGKFENKVVSLKVFPYPSVPEAYRRSQKKKGRAFASGGQGGCSLNPCSWCCAQCVPYPWSSDCGRSDCETGKIDCHPRDGQRCLLYTCV